MRPAEKKFGILFHSCSFHADTPILAIPDLGEALLNAIQSGGEMAECDWAILCDSGFQDIDRRACLIGIFDRVSATAVPTLLPHATLVVKVLGSPEETCSFRIEIATESGPPLFTAEGNCTLSEAGWHNIFVNFVNIVLPSFGSYSLNVYIEDYLSKATTFFIQETPPPQKQV